MAYFYFNNVFYQFHKHKKITVSHMLNIAAVVVIAEDVLCHEFASLALSSMAGGLLDCHIGPQICMHAKTPGKI